MALDPCLNPNSFKCKYRTACADRKSPKCKKFRRNAKKSFKKVLSHLKLEAELRKQQKTLSKKIQTLKKTCAKASKPEKAAKCSSRLNKLKKQKTQVKSRRASLQKQRSTDKALRRGLRLYRRRLVKKQ